MADVLRDRRDRAGAAVGLAALLGMAVVLVIGVPEDVGDRLVLPLVLLGVAAGIALSRRRLRLLAALAGAGVGAGLVLGSGLRLAMLVAALMGGGTERSAGGTLGLIAFSVVPMVVYSGGVALLRRLVPLGPAAAAVLTAVLGGAMLLAPADVRAEMGARGLLVVNLVTFIGAFGLAGFVLVRLQHRIEDWWDHRARDMAEPPAVSGPTRLTPA